jgi:hypothetical protein
VAAITKRRHGAAAPESKTVRTSVSFDVALHARLCAAASLRGCSISAYIESVVADSLKGLVIIDRRSKPPESNGTAEPPTE